MLASCPSDSKCLINISCYNRATVHPTHFIITCYLVVLIFLCMCVASVSNLMETSKRGRDEFF